MAGFVRDIPIYRGGQPFWAKGHSVLLLEHTRAEDKIMIWTFKSQVLKAEIFLFTSSIITCGLILLPSEQFRIVISWKIVNS